MKAELLGCCGGGDKYTLKLEANMSNADERRFIKKLSSGQLEIKGFQNVEYASSPDERRSCEVILEMNL